MVTSNTKAGIGSRAMNTLRVVAVLLALSLMIGEAWRSWGVGRPIMFVLDDQLMGGFLIATAWAVERGAAHSRAAFSAAWGVVAGMLYGSFFGKIFEPARAQAGNWDLGVLTWLLGVAFFTSLIGLWFSVILPERADR
ncbi:MAG: hypothetical protein ACK5V0_07650 [Alphaproteobacteria bacterium]|jgi:hypothetical protein